MRPINADAMIQDLRRQFEAIYKSAIETPIMPDDPFVELLAKCEGLHMKAYIDNLCEYIDSRPTIDAAPVRRGEWVEKSTVWGDELRCSVCGEQADYFAGSPEEVYCVRDPNFCPNCGADMRGVSE